MTATITVRQALAWRMRRHLLDPIGPVRLDEVVRRLCGVQAQVPSAVELATRVRRERSWPGDVRRALASGRLIRTWAMRGTIHLLTPEEGGAFLSLMAAGRSWEQPSWQRAFGMGTKEWDLFRLAVSDALASGPLTREELVAAIVRHRGLSHVGDALRSSWGTLLKPLAWQGDLCFGPSRGTRTTFQRPQDASERWTGVPEPEQAAPTAIASYLRAYGPATTDNFRNWLSRGRIGRRMLRAWFAELGDRLATVDVEGRTAHVLTEDLDELLRSEPGRIVRLLPGFDQYVLGPGTEDIQVVPAGHRGDVSRAAGWIAPVVVADGVVAGTWELDGDDVRVAWFADAGRPPRAAVLAEVERLAGILDRPLRGVISAR